MAKVVLTSLKANNFSDAEIDATVANAIDKLGFSFKSKTQSVVLKPNLCYYWNYSTGETTDPRIVSSIIDYVRHRLGNDVAISVAEADASAMKTKYSFKVLGYDKLCQAKNVELKNLSEGNIVNVKINVDGREIALPINEVLLKADLIINIPKLKTHNFVGATCALKNMFGAISKPRKYSYHEIISQIIVAINKQVKSHVTVVDGLIVHGSHPKKLGVILAGDDPLATDFVAAKIMGFNPRRIPYLNLAAKEQIGQVKNIELIEDNVKLKEIKKNFPSYNHFLHTVSWNMQLKMLRAYAKVAGDVLPSFLEK
ncbi:MAG TPA: DUF362 domain-containing protein [Candidatus Bathyarchaeia archaeon]|nr:DUF362 domain-containing protein [Candidatus Bathyarchaeia archaeon]